MKNSPNICVFTSLISIFTAYPSLAASIEVKSDVKGRLIDYSLTPNVKECLDQWKETGSTGYTKLDQQGIDLATKLSLNSLSVASCKVLVKNSKFSAMKSKSIRGGYDAWRISKDGSSFSREENPKSALENGVTVIEKLASPNGYIIQVLRSNGVIDAETTEGIVTFMLSWRDSPALIEGTAFMY